MAFGFISDIVETVGDVVLGPKGGGQRTGKVVEIGATMAGAPPQAAAFAGKVGQAYAGGGEGQGATSTPTFNQAAVYAPESALTSTGTQPINQQDYYNMKRGRQIIQGGMVPRLPAPRPTTQPKTTGADLMDLIPDISISKFFGDSGMACGMSQKKLVTVKMDGCVTVSRRQQNVLRKMLQYMPISEVAYQAGVDTQTMAYLVSKQFPPRRKGISASQLRNAKRVNNQILNMANKLGYDCKPMTTARRGKC